MTLFFDSYTLLLVGRIQTRENTTSLPDQFVCLCVFIPLFLIHLVLVILFLLLVFVSGGAEPPTGRCASPHDAFVQKPYTPSDIAAVARRMVGRG